MRLFVDGIFGPRKQGRPLYVELAYGKDEGHLSQSLSQGWESYVLRDAVAGVLPCLRLDKKDCPYRNLRAHYADARFFLDDYALPKPAGTAPAFVAFWNLFELSQLIPRYWTERVGDENERRIRRDYLNQLKLPSAAEVARGNYQTQMLTHAFGLPRIQKQFSHVADTALRKKVIESLRRTAEEIYGQFSWAPIHHFLRTALTHLQDPTYRPTGEEIQRLVHTCQEIRSIFHVWFSPIMDAYLLGRMFRGYADGAIESRNVFLLVGDAHASVYRKVLDQLDYTTVEYPSLSSRNSQCVDISALRIPLFDRNHLDMKW